MHPGRTGITAQSQQVNFRKVHTEVGDLGGKMNLLSTFMPVCNISSLCELLGQKFSLFGHPCFRIPPASWAPPQGAAIKGSLLWVCVAELDPNFVVRIVGSN